MNTLFYIDGTQSRYNGFLIESNRELIQSVLIEQGRVLREIKARDLSLIQKIVAGEVSLIPDKDLKRILRSYSNEELLYLCRQIQQKEMDMCYTSCPVDLDTSVNREEKCERKNRWSRLERNLLPRLSEPVAPMCDESSSIAPDPLQEALRLIKQLENEQRLHQLGAMLDEDIFNQLRQEHTPDLVKIRVDNHWRILSQDADIEVKMPILSKVLYFLFLRHPEGIVLKQISDYRDELLKIYLLFSPSRAMRDVIASIDALTDVSDGSINQKISRVNAAFQTSLSYSNTWQILGKRGDVKKIEAAESVEIPERLRTLI